MEQPGCFDNKQWIKFVHWSLVTKYEFFVERTGDYSLPKIMFFKKGKDMISSPGSHIVWRIRKGGDK